MNRILRHLLAAIAYRFQKSIKFANKSFVNLEVGHNVRPPVEILHHMVMVLEYGTTMLSQKEMVKHELGDWDQEAGLFHEKLAGLDRLLTEPLPDESTVFKLLQGPLSDVLTHIGQLAMLSRMNGAPIDWENFTAADVKIGRVGGNQNLV